MERNTELPTGSTHAGPAAESVALTSSSPTHPDPLVELAPARSNINATVNSPRLAVQRRLIENIQNSPRMAAQRTQIESMFEDSAQLVDGPAQEESLQGKFETAQRQEAEEQELLQGKFATKVPNSAQATRPQQLEATLQRTIRRAGGGKWLSTATGRYYGTRTAASAADKKAGGTGLEDLRETAADLGMMSEYANSVVHSAPDAVDTRIVELLVERARDLGRAAQETIAGRSDAPLNPSMSTLYDRLELEVDQLERNIAAHNNSLEVMIAATRAHQAATNPLAGFTPPESDEDSF